MDQLLTLYIFVAVGTMIGCILGVHLLPVFLASSILNEKFVFPNFQRFEVPLFLQNVFPTHLSQALEPDLFAASGHRGGTRVATVRNLLNFGLSI